MTIWGAIINVALSGLKLLAGILGHSSAMLADAFHSLSDLVSDAVVLIMVRIASKGLDIIIDSHLVVDSEMTVAEAHRITEIAESALRRKFGENPQISLHVEPDDEC